ncbi:hypothetical protein [Thermoflexibacter ruber]|uniref:Lipoprotein n=1 Tax=Thermoflexibacter ruber TaxID=1003 RepID=A0A1I2GXR1_9BACT|nr:hypothetical protein [Thermoflexibacter ruber]SFF21943.1 hypothetical protein SAMN04488541_102083 [Thermoflexibacter ruber]
MKNNFKKIGFMLSLSLLVITSACKKENNASPSAEVDETTIIQTSESDQVINDVISTVDDAMDGKFDGIGNGRVEACGDISLNLQQRSLTIDFGNGCQGLFGRTRKGKMTVVFTDNQRTITFQNYAVESYTISGTIVQSNITRSNTQISYTTNASNLQITTPNKKITVNNLQRTTRISFGTNPKQIIDNEVRISGTSAGINNSGETFTTEITTPLVIKQACFQSGVFYPVSGVSVVKVGSKPSMTLNFGSGTCDKQVEVSLGNISKTITLP